MRTNPVKEAKTAFSENHWQDIFNTLTQISGNLLEAIQFMKMQDAALTMVSRNLDRSIHLKARLEESPGSVESVQQEYEILHAHIGGLSENQYKQQFLFKDHGGDAIRIYSFENGQWISLVMDQPDLNGELFRFLRGGRLLSGADPYTIQVEDLMEAQQVILNYRLSNGAQTERIETSLKQIRITMTQLNQLVPYAGSGDPGENLVSIEESVARGESVLAAAQGFANGMTGKLATA
jgi:hypothetical protein